MITLRLPLFARLAPLCALALVSCATMTPQECRHANWREIGLIDGLAGKSLALLNTRSSDCAEANVRVDAAAYQSGREQGLKSYCQLDNAVRVGLNGSAYEGVCEPAIDGEFRRRHRLGFDVYLMRAEVARLDQRAEALEQRLSALTLEHDAHRERERRSNDREGRRDGRDSGRDGAREGGKSARDDDGGRHYDDSGDERRRIRQELKELDARLRLARDRLRDAEWALNRR